MYVCMYVCSYLFIYSSLFICLLNYLVIYMYINIHEGAYTFRHIHIHTHMHACMHACMHASIHTYVSTYVRTYVRTYIHTYIHTYKHRQLFFYMHTCIQTHRCWFLLPERLPASARPCTGLVSTPVLDNPSAPDFPEGPESSVHDTISGCRITSSARLEVSRAQGLGDCTKICT